MLKTREKNDPTGDPGEQHGGRAADGHGVAGGRARGQPPRHRHPQQPVRPDGVHPARPRRPQHHARPGQRAAGLQHGPGPLRPVGPEDLERNQPGAVQAQPRAAAQPHGGLLERPEQRRRLPGRHARVDLGARRALQRRHRGPVQAAAGRRQVLVRERAERVSRAFVFLFLRARRFGGRRSRVHDLASCETLRL